MENSSKSNGTKTFLEGLVGQYVKINRGGPESLQGTLVAVKNDYLVLWTKEGIVYVSTSHVKSITDFPSNKSGGCKPDYIKASSFVGVIRALNHKFVQINWGGPEKIEGFIAEVGNTSLLLVVNREVVQIQLLHIKTIKPLGQNTSRGDRSGGNRSGGNSNRSLVENRARHMLPKPVLPLKVNRQKGDRLYEKSPSAV
ncbi:spore coat protein B [Paenibacillus algorifonticola]|uniref:Spore coat protein B n=1 Tax=Paenibacillus algorifonticola TaxID=684063 RepID=A0A1I2G5Q6_9BACL|nr:hypothetical protein [Paenibacillus algorifonticola]SFF12508.1 spore coat protein B [Paenibacillus algorifonticola]